MFFERNGLAHGEFNLEFQTKDVYISDLAWSIDSNLLAVTIIDKDITRVLVYSMCNYHYYSSYQLDFPNGLDALLWDEEEPMVLHSISGIFCSFNAIRWNHAAHKTF
jgi:elongator complex protein 1